MSVNTVPRMSPHAASIPPSSVHAIYRSVNEWQRSTGRVAARLDVGEPHFGPPAAALEALAAAGREGRTGYTSAEGLLALREALTDKLNRRNDMGTTVDRVYVCTGAAQGLASLMRALANPGEEILLPALHWPIHHQQSLLAGLRPVSYPLDAGFRPDLDALRRLGTDRTRILLLNTPGNPTGAVYDLELLAGLLELAREMDWQVISDEAYEDFVYTGEHLSVAALERDLPAAERRVSTVYSYSKSYAMTGLRLGYVALPDRRRGTTFQTVQEAAILSSPTPVQYAGLAALGCQDYLASVVASVRESRDALRPLIDAGLLAGLPSGGWFALLDISRLDGIDTDRFAAELLAEHAVAVAPGYGFAMRSEVAADGTIRPSTPDPVAVPLLRLAFCGQPDIVGDAVARIVTFAGEIRA